MMQYILRSSQVLHIVEFGANLLISHSNSHKKEIWKEVLESFAECKELVADKTPV